MPIFDKDCAGHETTHSIEFELGFVLRNINLQFFQNLLSQNKKFSTKKFLKEKSFPKKYEQPQNNTFDQI